MRKHLLLIMMLTALFPWSLRAQISIPYTEGFESMSSASDLTTAGWISYATQARSKLVIVSSENVNTGSKALSLDSWDASNSSAVLIAGLPVLAQPINGLRITFSYKVSTGTVAVGYLTDADDASSFVQIQSFSASSVYTQKVVDLNDAPSTAARIAIKYTNYYRCYIDDIYVDLLPTCLPPTALAVSNITTTSADITWTASGHGETQWQYIVGEQGFTPDWTSATLVNTTSASLTNLTAYTNYDVYVRSYCSSSDQSSPIKASLYTGYCIPSPSSVDRNGISRVQFGTVDNTTHPHSSPYYGDYSSQVGTVWAGVETTVSITYSTGYTYGTLIWIDLNNNLTFEPSEVVYAGTSTDSDPTTLDASFTLPVNTPVGNYRMRIGGADSYFDTPISSGNYESADPCYTGTYTIFEDYTINVEAAPSCMPPTNLSVSNIGSSSADISWTSDASSFVVAYGTGTDPDAMLTTVNATTNSAALTGLTPLTTYHVFVKADCGSGDQSAWSNMVTFTTTAVATVVDVTHPFNEDFEGSVSFEFVNGSGDAWVVGSATSYGDSKSLYISGDGGTTCSYSSTNTVNFAKKLVALGNGTYHLNYYWMCKGEESYGTDYDYLRVFLAPSSCTFTAGSMPSGLSPSAVPMGWIALDGGAALNQQETWQNHTQDFTVTEGTYYLVFMWRTDGSGGNNPPAAVDNISLTLPSCATPVNVAATDITAHGATLSWISSASNFVVAYGTGTDPDAMATTNSATLTGLNANTVYNVFVKAVCGANDESEWSAMKTFRTECEAISSLPYTMSFEAGEGVTTGDYSNGYEDFIPCWNKKNDATGTGSYAAYPYAYSTYSHTGSNCLYFYQSNGTSYPLNQIAILPEVNTSVYQVNALRLKFWAMKSSSSYDGTLVVGAMSNPADATTFEAVDTVTLTTSYAEYTILLDGYTGSGAYVAIKCPKPNSASYQSIYLDDLTLELAPTCMEASDIVVSEITSSGATITWTKGAETQDNFVVAYGTGTDPDAMLTTVNATTNSAALTGLAANTAYNVFVKAVCLATDQSPWSNMGSFRTLCNATTIAKSSPYIDNFDSYTGVTSGATNYLPECWNYYNAGTYSSYKGYPVVYNSATSAHSGNNFLYFYSAYNSTANFYGDQYAILPEVSNVSATQLKLYARQYSTTTSYKTNLLVGVMTDPADTTTFELVETISPAGPDYEDFTVYFDQYTGTGTFIALRVNKPTSSGQIRYMFVDDIELKLIPSCFPVASISFDNVERTSMTIKWTKNSNPAATNTDYQVVLSTTQLDADGLAAAHPVDVLNATTYTATNLERNTLYYVYVRSSCDNGDDYSEWVEATQRTPDLGADCSVSSLEQTIGTGTSAIQYLPWSDFYKSTYSQQIYTAAEMTAAGFSAGYITKVAFQYALSASYTKTVTIYMGTTTDASFSSTLYKEVTAVTSATATTFNTAGAWYEFEFDTPFYWDGTSNIVVGAMNIGTNYPTSGTPTFYGGTTNGSMALYSRTDNGTPSTVTGTLTSNRANIKITVCPPASACPEITGLQVVNNDVHEVEFGWTASTGDYVSEYEVFNYKAEAPDYGPLADVDGYYETLQQDDVQVVTGTSVTVSDLDENTVYYLYVRALCNANDHNDGMSDWVEFSYKTKARCLTPVGLDATVNGKKDVTVTWANDSYDSEREIYVQESNFYWILATDDITEGGNIDIDINHSAVVAHNFDGENGGVITDDLTVNFNADGDIDVLDYGQTYYFYVRNDCLGDGAWDYITFTTPDECPAVVNLAVSNQTAHTALLTWDKGEYGDETEWKVAWGSNEFYTTEQSFLVYGLAAEETTQVSVYAACDKNHGVFGTAATVDVTTTAEGGNFVQVGNGTTSYTYYIPVNNYYKYSYSQQIFDASELKAGTIEAISYQYMYSLAMTEATDVTIYMGHTTKTAFESNADWISISQLTQVYNGALNCSQGWNDFTLNTPFEYNGQDNLIVAVHDNTVEFENNGTYYKFYSSNCTGDKTLYYQSDNTACPAAAPVAGTRAAFRNNTRFIFVSEACPKVTEFNVDDITTETANVSWMPAGGEMTWNYVVSTSAALDADASIIAHAENYAQRFVELNGLTSGVHYFLYVQSICDAETVSAWSAPYEFVTIATCPAPTALLVSNITNESVQLTWTVGGTESEWEVIYSSDNGANWSTPVSATENPYTLLTGLSGNTDYQVKVKAVCSPTDDSYYTPVVNFTTECNPTIITKENPYIENFDAETFPPDCWSQTQLALTNTWSRTTSTKHGSTGGAAYIPDKITGTKTALVTNAIAFDGSTDYQVIFWMYRGTSYQSKEDEAIHVYVGPDADNVTNATEIGVINQHCLNAPAEAAPDWYEYTFDVPANTAGNKYVLFVYHNQWGAGAYIDDITIRKTPTCFKPVHVTVSNVSNNSAEISWVAGAEETAWQVAYSTNGETWTTKNAGTNRYTLTELTGNTPYYVKVRSYCSDDDQSEYTQTVAFTTLCDALDLPYSENFESYSSSATDYNVAGIMPNCWDYIFSGTSPIYAPHISASYAPTTTGILLTSGRETFGSDNYVILPAFNGVQNSTISYSYKMESSANGTLYFGYITDATDASTFVSLVQLTSSTSKTDVSNYVVAGKVPDNARLAFKWQHSSLFYRVNIDDISVSPVNVFNTDGNIATATNWSGAAVPTTTTGYIAAEATVSEDFTIADLNILEGGKVTVNNGAKLTVTGTLTNNDEANLVINNGGQLVNASATKATVKKEITAYSTETGTDADGWYLIAAPITDAAAIMVTTGNYDFYAHDEAAYMWRNYKVEGNPTAYSWLTNGYGYLYANAATQTLNFAGTLAADDQKEIALAYTSTGDNTGWNLLGNHTAHNAKVASDFGITSVKVMDARGIDFTDRLIATGTIAPCEGFFVKATEAGQHVTINPTSTAKSQEAPQGFIQLNLVDNNTPVFTDVAYITMEGGIGSENITFSEVSPQLYVPMNGVDYSVAVVDADLTVIPVGFKATANSSYTISLNLINAHFETVILRDLKTGIDTDLKAGNYVFNGDIDDAENRFNLILAVEAPEGIGENNEPFAYQSGSDIIFTDAYGTVQVMDVLGRVMSETRIDGAARISTRGLVSGTYVLRLLGNESVRTQKIVVK